MRREPTRQTLKLHLLAFVLALALAWYSLNPAPGSIDRSKRDDELPDEKKREAGPGLQGSALFPALLTLPGARPLDEPVSNLDEDDDFEWPEFIDG